MENRVFTDFHDHGASAPAWNQRYHQLSSGLMRSTLHEVSFGQVHLFRKALSERVVQQGCLPAGKISFAVPQRLPGAARMQGREVSTSSLFILRSGDDFTMHRPKGMELLALTFDAQRFARHLDACGTSALVKWALPHPVIEAPGAPLEQWRTRMLAVLGDAPATAGAEAGLEQLLFETVTTLLCHAVQGRGPRLHRRSAAAYIVDEGHRMATAAGGAALTVDDLCRRLRTSRRTVQGSFNAVTETAPLQYLRSIRLNAVRRQLLAARGGASNVAALAAASGFAHLGHFAAAYRALFGELPSQTLRQARAQPR